MYLFTLAQWMEADGVDPGRFPKVAAHRDRVRADPVVSRVILAELAPS
jgi:glutathione S-transferase